MKTGSLIGMLAQGAGPAPSPAIAQRLCLALAVGLVASCALALLTIEPLSAATFATPAPWIKLTYAISLGLTAALLTGQLARPIARLSSQIVAVAAVFLAMVSVAGLSFLQIPPGLHTAALLGQTWWMCLWLLLGFSLPALAATLWAERGLAPTRLRAAGFACGLLAGAVDATGYSLARPESSAAFVAIWYSLGIAMTALLGTALGPRLLRW
jgi:hypothetical protein